MPTQAIAGCGGSVSATPNPGDVGDEIMNWTLTIERELLDATSFDSNCFQEWVEGITSAAGSLVAKGAAPILGAMTALTLQVNTAAGSYQIQGNAILNSITPNVQVKGEVVQYAANFAFTGDITVGVVV